jgi:hypothetical protein
MARMSCALRSPQLAVVALLLLLLAHVAGATEQLLSWDDGECDGPFWSVHSPSGVRVVFVAPEWATQIEAVRVFLVDSMDSPGAVCMRVFKPLGPPPPDNLWFPVGSTVYLPCSPESTWCEEAFAEPVEIDAVEFPGGLFSVVLVWDEPPHPLIGMDTDEPLDGMTYVPYDNQEVGFAGGDVMIQARVSDGNTPVRQTSWSRVKALLR